MVTFGNLYHFVQLIRMKSNVRIREQVSFHTFVRKIEWNPFSCFVQIQTGFKTVISGCKKVKNIAFTIKLREFILFLQKIMTSFLEEEKTSWNISHCEFTIQGLLLNLLLEVCFFLHILGYTWQIRKCSISPETEFTLILCVVPILSQSL